MHAACMLRASWKNTGRDTCINCRASVTAPTCECEAFKEFAGLCLEQNVARVAEPSCTKSVDDCVHKCAATDCDCVDRCYVNIEACKRVSAAVDGCTADVCGPHCL